MAGPRFRPRPELAGRGRPVLLLTGRSPQPPEGLLEELAGLGADARYHRADLTSRDDVEALVAAMPAPDAVFHAAGVVRPGACAGRRRRRRWKHWERRRSAPCCWPRRSVAMA
ncbi:KR domain-containing protein [Streptomyces sp. M10(2022)]